jgi:Xaa-Pro aminopeptidase
MCVTVEPGFYQIPLLQERARARPQLASLVNWDELQKYSDVRGIRIEDDVLVTSTGASVLSEGAPKEVTALEALLGGDPI